MTVTAAIEADTVTAVIALQEAVLTTRRDRALAAPAKRVRKALRAMWRAQRLAVVAALRKHRSAFAAEESLREADMPPWEGDFDSIASATARNLTTTLDAEYPRGLRTGAGHAIADTRAAISFDVAHPDAARFLAGRGASRVTAINDTTRASMRVLLSNAVDGGWSWTRTAREIETMFAGFSGAVPQSFLRTRAELVAATELAEAYEHGQSVVRSDLAASGLDVEKSWLTVGDSRVSAECAANEAEGWIADGGSFGSGASSPPEHPGCRCSSLSRVNTGVT